MSEIARRTSAESNRSKEPLPLDPDRDPWQRQRAEEGLRYDDRWHAFLIVRDVLGERNITELAIAAGANPNTWRAWARRHRWLERIAQYDAHTADEGTRRLRAAQIKHALTNLEAQQEIAVLAAADTKAMIADPAYRPDDWAKAAGAVVALVKGVDALGGGGGGGRGGAGGTTVNVQVNAQGPSPEAMLREIALACESDPEMRDRFLAATARARTVPGEVVA